MELHEILRKKSFPNCIDLLSTVLQIDCAAESICISQSSFCMKKKVDWTLIARRRDVGYKALCEVLCKNEYIKCKMSYIVK